MADPICIPCQKAAEAEAILKAAAPTPDKFVFYPPNNNGGNRGRRFNASELATKPAQEAMATQLVAQHKLKKPKTSTEEIHLSQGQAFERSIKAKVLTIIATNNAGDTIIVRKKSKRKAKTSPQPTAKGLILRIQHGNLLTQKSTRAGTYSLSLKSVQNKVASFVIITIN